MRRAIERPPGRRRRGRHLEDRGRRHAGGRRDARRADPQGRRPRERQAACCSAAAPTTTRSTTGCARPRRVDGFIGFAIGRSIWWDALKGFLDGDLERDDAVGPDRRELPALREGLPRGCAGARDRMKHRCAPGRAGACARQRIITYTGAGVSPQRRAGSLPPTCECGSPLRSSRRPSARRPPSDRSAGSGCRKESAQRSRVRRVERTRKQGTFRFALLARRSSRRP